MSKINEKDYLTDEDIFELECQKNELILKRMKEKKKNDENKVKIREELFSEFISELTKKLGIRPDDYERMIWFWRENSMRYFNQENFIQSYENFTKSN